MPLFAKLKEAGNLVTSGIDSESRVIQSAIIIKAGESRNRNDYPAGVLRRDGPTVFEGSKGYMGHVETFFQQTDPRNLACVVKNVVFQESDQSLRGDIHYFSDADPVVTKAKEAFDKGLTDLFGLSIQVRAKHTLVRDKGRLVRKVESLIKDSENTSVDMVVGPSAGGRLFESIQQEETEMDLTKLTLEELKAARPDLYEAIVNAAKGRELTVESFKKDHSDLYTAILAEAQKVDPPKQDPPKTEPTLDIEGKIQEGIKAQVAVITCGQTLENLLTEANLPGKMAAKVRAKFSGVVFEEADLKKEIADFKEMAATLAEGTNVGRLTIIGEPRDRFQIAMDKLLGVHEGTSDVPAFKGIREAYTVATGDVDVTGQIIKLKESFDSSSLPYALSTSMNKRLIKDYRAADYEWRKFCSVGSVPDFKTQDRIRIGYLGDLDDVDPEVADYQQIATYTDEKAYFSVIQKGNLLSLSRKFILNDDMSTFTKIVGRLGRAASRTLAKRVYVTRLAGNTAYTGDTLAFFLDSVGDRATVNLGALALSADNIWTSMVAMQKYTEPDSGERIGLQCRPGSMYLIVPVDLLKTAKQINQFAPIETVPSTLYHFFGANDENIIASPLLTDATDWYLAFVPDEIDWIEVAFLQGREDPEFWLQDNPVVGDVFMADKWTYKIRHEYEVVFLDPRGCYKHVVGG
jgi:hypothetical protein